MHRCLRIIEILSSIFNFASKPTLYALVLTCRLFHTPAIEHLWSSSHIFNLLRCFPQDLIGVDPSRPALLFRRTLKESDCFSLYVKKLTFNSVSSRSNICSHVPRLVDLSLHKSQYPEPFMRRLRTIHCTTSDDSYLLIVHPFLGPNLTIFSMQDRKMDAAQASLVILTILVILRFRSPLLELTICLV